MTLNWIRPNSGGWFQLLSLDFSHQHFSGLEGVYLIWHAGQGPNVVRVGQGIIGDRLGKHSSDNNILAYARKGTLYATWAEVRNQGDRDRVERFLANSLNPFVGDAFPNAMPLAVNLPA